MFSETNYKEKLRSFSFKRKSRQTKPYSIMSDFKNTTEKECIKIDKANQSNYARLLSKANLAQSTIKNSGLSMNLEVPLPPRPSNRDRFLLWKKRNISKPVIEQSEAVLFLKDNGFDLNKHYEAYQAIELSKEIKKQKGIKSNFQDKSKDFNDIYTKKDKNIFRRRSIYDLENLIS